MYVGVIHSREEQRLLHVEEESGEFPARRYSREIYGINRLLAAPPPVRAREIAKLNFNRISHSPAIMLESSIRDFFELHSDV